MFLRSNALRTLSIAMNGFSLSGRLIHPPAKLSTPAREHIIQFTRDAFNRKWNRAELTNLVDLALATGDDQLLQKVEALVDSPAAAMQMTGTDSVQEGAGLNFTLRKRLDEYDKNRRAR